MSKYREQFNIIIGKRLRERRIEMGFRSQESFAAKIGVTRGAVANWELGESGIADENYPEIKRVLKVDDDFFKIESNSPDSSLRILTLIGRLSALNESELDGAINLFDDYLSSLGRDLG